MPNVGISAPYLLTVATHCSAFLRVAAAVDVFTTVDCHHVFAVRLMLPYVTRLVPLSMAPGSPMNCWLFV